MRHVTSYFSTTVQYAAPLTFNQFIRAYDGRRRTLYQDAYDSLLVRPLTAKDAQLNYFVKIEKGKRDAVPRGINPRDPRYHVSLGPYIKRIEKIVYAMINQLFGYTVVFKGLNAEQRGQLMYQHWCEFADPVAISLDASRFDQHTSDKALKWEHSIYQMFFPHDKRLKWLLKLQINNKGFARCPDGFAKFKKKGGRMSGDMNTSLGNVLIMCCMVFAFLNKIPIKKHRLANDGDDCVVILERSDLDKFRRYLKPYFRNMGYNMTVEEPVYNIEQIDFCQCNPIWTPQGYLMVRNIHRALAKDCISIKPLDNVKVAKRWLAAVGEAGLSLTGGIPIWQDFYLKLYNTAGGAKPLKNDPTLNAGFFKYFSENMKRVHDSVHPRTRLSFYTATNIPPDAQIAFENMYTKSLIDVKILSSIISPLVPDWLGYHT